MMSFAEMRTHQPAVTDAYMKVFDKMKPSLQEQITGFGMNVDDKNQLYITVNCRTYTAYLKCLLFLPKKSDNYKIKYRYAGIARML